MHSIKKIKLVDHHLVEHQNMVVLIRKNLKTEIYKAAKMISSCLKNNGTVFWCGNGGSASDSLHLSAELIGRFKKNRIPLKSISLAGNPSTLTCISNDFGYDNLFSRQIKALGTAKDILIPITTSGTSKNILKAIDQAKKNKLKIISFLGCKGGKCKGKSNLDLIVSSSSTARIQEAHIMIGHIICDLVEKEMKL